MCRKPTCGRCCDHEPATIRDLCQPHSRRTSMIALPEETRDLLALQLIPGLGPLRIAALLEHFGSPGAILAASAEQLAGVSGIGSKLSADIVQGRREVDVEEELRLLEKHGVRLVARGTPEYPAALAEIYDPPHLLY